MKKVDLRAKVVTENERLAALNRDRFDRAGTLVLNFVSSPGSGKTALLEETVKHLKDRYSVFVLTGDLMTDNDASRIRRHGVQAVQITTGEACHLDASMVSRNLPDPAERHYDLVMIENVGNLVCPASFDLGEDLKVLLISVAEGDDKPLKYPPMVRASGVLAITKIDLVPYTDSRPEEIAENALKINPDLQVFFLSTKTHEGVDRWIEWLKARLTAKGRARTNG